MRIALIILMATLAAQAAPVGFNTTPIPGLVGWWTFNTTNSNGTVSDFSGYANTGFTSNAPSVVVGISGNALQFNGSDQKVRTLLTPTSTNLTMVYWSNISSFVAANTTISDLASQRLISYVSANNGTAAFGAFTDGVNAYRNITFGLSTGVWAAIAVVYDSNTVFVYKNGLLIGSKALSAGSAVFNGALNIGVRASNNTEWVNGAIDDVRIYNRALTAEEILKLYNGGRATQQ